MRTKPLKTHDLILSLSKDEDFMLFQQPAKSATAVVPERRSLVRDCNRSKRLSFLRSRLALRLVGMFGPQYTLRGGARKQKLD
jgi:hypothetical protein